MLPALGSGQVVGRIVCDAERVGAGRGDRKLHAPPVGVAIQHLSDEERRSLGVVQIEGDFRVGEPP